MKTLTDQEIQDLSLLEEMYRDGYFPDALVDRIKDILISVCRQIEASQPANDADLYLITHAGTEKINDLQDDFEEAESDIETVARDSIAVSFGKVASAYGFEPDLEELVATRDW
jgi:hypothetical protein